MSLPDDGRDPEAPRSGGAGPGRPTNDPDQVTRRGAAGRRLVALVAGIVLLVVLVVWLIVYLSARETSDESLGAAAAVQAQAAVQEWGSAVQ